MYEELMEKEIIPEMNPESPEELSAKELANVVDFKVEPYDQQIVAGEDVTERKELRSKRKAPKKYHKHSKDYVKCKQEYENDMTIFGERIPKRIMMPYLCE